MFTLLRESYGEIVTWLKQYYFRSKLADEERIQKGPQTNDFVGQRYLSSVNCRRVKGNPVDLNEVDSIEDKKVKTAVNFLGFEFPFIKTGFIQRLCVTVQLITRNSLHAYNG